ncbi:MAG: hypothetical protein GY696_28535 [Gammaproteobacteria bacterium]|nr:hypothetical protein [Gammaproteobacteria bacterium]
MDHPVIDLTDSPTSISPSVICDLSTESDPEDEEKEEEEYIDGVYPLQKSAITSFEDAAKHLIRGEKDFPLAAVCTTVPESAPLRTREVSFLVDLQAIAHPDDLLVDKHGAWGRSSGKCAFYTRQSRNKFTKVDADGKLELGRKFHVKLKKLYWTHKDERSLKKFVFRAESAAGNLLRWGIICYKWDCQPHLFVSAPHGLSSGNRQESFQPVRPSVKAELKTLGRTAPPKKIMAEFFQKRGGVENIRSTADMPRDAKQVSYLAGSIPGRVPLAKVSDDQHV